MSPRRMVDAGGRIGPYVVEARIATGGMAEVYLAKRIGPYGFEKRVALKRIVPRYATDPEFVAMFIDEARLAARLSHPNIVNIFDFGEHGDNLFIAMEHVEGTNLNRFLRGAVARNQKISLDNALYIALHVARALAYAHGSLDENGRPLGIVHRDVSPANILLSRTGDVKLSDFGIARAADMEQRTDAGHLRGKLGYMSPEQVVGDPLDARSDQFTLGVCLAEMILLEPLFGAGTDLDILMRIRDADLGLLQSDPMLVQADVRRMLERMLERRPIDRFATAANVAEQIEDIARQRRLRMGPARLARVLHRMQLVGGADALAGAVTGTSEPTQSTTGSVTTYLPEERLTAVTSVDPLDVAAVTSPSIYRIAMGTGQVLGPMSYPRLVELFAAGEIDGNTRVSVGGGPFAPARERPELTRFVTSPALRWSREDEPPATLEGDVSRVVLPKLVHKLAYSRETGVLHLRDSKRRKKIYFVDGRPEFIASTDRSELLGEFLVKRGYCVRMEVEMALALLPRFGGRLGDALVGLGILRPVELFRVIGEQVRRRYFDAFRWREGEYAYARGVRSHEEAFPLGRDPYELITEAIATCYAPDELEATMEPYLERVLIPEPVPPTPLRAFGMPESWAHVLTSLHGDATLAAIVGRETTRGGADPIEVYRAVFLGLACDLCRAL